jgi:hypothetical protein
MDRLPNHFAMQAVPLSQGWPRLSSGVRNIEGNHVGSLWIKKVGEPEQPNNLPGLAWYSTFGRIHPEIKYGASYLL